jgi:hypothetical protein
MSSDTFHIEIVAIDGARIDLHCTTGLSGGVNDLACTRSFALMALDSALDRPWKRKPCVRKPEKHPLRVALTALNWSDQCTEEDFYKAHVGEFVSDVTLTYRNLIADEEAWSAQRELLRERFRLAEVDDTPLDRMLPKHSFGLRVQMTHAKWLKELKAGYAYGATAYDVWWEDPKAAASRALLRKKKPPVESSAWIEHSLFGEPEPKVRAGARVQNR